MSAPATASAALPCAVRVSEPAAVQKQLSSAFVREKDARQTNGMEKQHHIVRMPTWIPAMPCA